MLPVPSDKIQLVLGAKGPLVSASPVITVEPRRRRFHAPIILTIPAPETSTSKQRKPTKDGSKLHLLYSITGNLLLVCCMPIEVLKRIYNNNNYSSLYTV